MDCRWNGEVFSLSEVHRFANGGVSLDSHLYWDAQRLWTEIQNGLKRFRGSQQDVPAGIGIDAWGVDYCLLDGQDRLLANPHHYRDSRTQGMMHAMESTMSGLELFRATGVQSMEINTCFQLASMSGKPDLQAAHSLLMIPDYFQFLLSGAKRAEYTEATTMELYDQRAHRWSQEVLARLQLPAGLFQEVVLPGTTLGPLLPGVQAECGFTRSFPCIAVASHDTASAVAAIPDLDQSSAFLSSGTWSLMGVPVDQPNLTDEAYYGGFTNEGAANGGVLLLKNMTGLWILQECVRIWDAEGRQSTWSELELAAAQAKGFRSFVDPAAKEFRSPIDMCEAIQRFCVRSQQPVPQTVGEIARCVFESLCFTYRAALEDFERLTGRALHTIRLVGGGCLNQVLCQMMADAAGRTVLAGPVEAAALGNGLVQALATGHLKSFAEGQAALRQSVNYQTYLPARNSGWDEAFARYRSLISQESLRNQETSAECKTN